MSHIKLTKEGTEQLQRGQLHALQMEMAFLTGVTEPLMGSDRQIMFAARLYRCAHCGTRYESLPGLQGAIKCRNCGSPDVWEER